LCTVYIFVSSEEKGCYRIVSLGHQNFDSRSYCGLSRRMQGVVRAQNKGEIHNVSLTGEVTGKNVTDNAKVLKKDQYFLLLYIELAISFQIGRKRRVNFRNQHL